MPLIVKTGAMKVKDPSSGNYVDVDMSLGVDYAPINSPAFSGTPTAPTATASTNNTQIATTAFVQGLVSTEASARQSADSAFQSSLNAEITARQNVDNAIESAIAYVETTVTASRTYKKGDYLYYTVDNRLFRLTTDVPQGTSFSGKVAGVKLADEVSNAIVPEELTISAKENSYATINPDIFKAIRYGSIVVLNFQLGVADMPTDAAHYTQIANIILPRNLFTVYSTLIPAQQGSNYSILRVLINPDGGVWIMNPEAGKTATGWYRGTMNMVLVN